MLNVIIAGLVLGLIVVLVAAFFPEEEKGIQVGSKVVNAFGETGVVVLMGPASCKECKAFGKNYNLEEDECLVKLSNNGIICQDTMELEEVK